MSPSSVEQLGYMAIILPSLHTLVERSVLISVQVGGVGGSVALLSVLSFPLKILVTVFHWQLQLIDTCQQALVVGIHTMHEVSVPQA